MKIQEVPLGLRFIGRDTILARITTPVIIAQEGSDRGDQSDRAQPLAGPGEAIPQTSSTGTPAQGAAGEQTGLFAAQRKMDIAYRDWQASLRKIQVPAAERDRLHGIYQDRAAAYNRLWPGDDHAPFTEESRPRRQGRQRLTENARLERKLRIAIRYPGSKRTRKILQENPQLAREYEPVDIQRATELANEGTLFWDSLLIPDLRRENWRRQMEEPIQSILAGFSHLLPKRGPMLIKDAIKPLDEEIQRLSQPGGDQQLKEIYEDLLSQWPHVIKLHEEGRIETAAGAFAYYRALEQLRKSRAR